ncbi:MAG: cytochrome c peroxidase [Novosphingobium sp.]
MPESVASPPVPADNALSSAKVELGRRLFYDADLSADGTMSCASCHVQRHAFADSIATRGGINGDAGRRNAPGLGNVAWLSPLTFADPAATTLEVQVHTPILGTHPVEMGMAQRQPEIGQRLGKDACYRRMFAKAFPESESVITFTSVARALASFQRTMVSYSSNFDREVLSVEARAGRVLFNRDCASCHAGPQFTDLSYHRIGPADVSATDQGLFEATGIEADRGKFRTPSLRNVALTGPWWHDGSAATMEIALTRHGLSHIARETAEIAAFLDALSDHEFTERRSLSMPDRACGKRL